MIYGDALENIRLKEKNATSSCVGAAALKLTT
jgi:hypothetical protein